MQIEAEMKPYTPSPHSNTYPVLYFFYKWQIYHQLIGWQKDRLLKEIKGEMLDERFVSNKS